MPPAYPYNPFACNTLEARAAKIFSALEMNRLCVGFDYMCIAVVEAYHHPEITLYATKTLAPHVAKICGHNRLTVYKAMSRAVDGINRFKNKKNKQLYLGDPNIHATVLNVVTKVSEYLRNEDAKDAFLHTENKLTVNSWGKEN